VSEGSTSWSVVALTALAVAAPFNVRVSSSAWTDLHLRILVVIGLAIAVSVVVHSLSGPQRRKIDWIDALCAWWFVAVWVSTALSASPFVGSGGAVRLSIPILLLPAVRHSIRTQRDAIVLLRGVASGALLGALVGLLVWLLGSRLDPTQVFVGQVTSLGPFQRLTSPWAHANVAAMALGATLATGATLRPRALAAVALCFSVVALVLTTSRGGLLAGAVAVFAWMSIRRRRTESVAAFALIGVAAATFFMSPAWSARVDQLGDEAFYNVSIVAPVDFTIGEANDHQLIVGITNRSSTTWSKAGADRVLISARWFGPDGLIWTEDRWELPDDLRPGESVDAYLGIEPRLPIGDAYHVRWDLLILDTAYFGQFIGLPPVLSSARITSSPVQPNQLQRYPLVERTMRLDRPYTWRLAWEEFTSNPLLGVGPNQFGDAATDDLFAENQQVGSHAHNIVLEPLATWGLIGALPFFALFAAAIGRSTSRAWRDRTLLSTVVAVGIVAVATHGLVDWPLVVVTTGIPIGLLLGLALSRLEPA